MKKYILVELDTAWMSTRRFLKALADGKELTRVYVVTTGYDAPVVYDYKNRDRQMDDTAPLFTIGGDK